MADFKCYYAGGCCECYQAGRGMQDRYFGEPCAKCGSESNEALTVGRICGPQCDHCRDREQREENRG